MQTPWHAGRHASISARHWWWPWLLLAAAFLPICASASCLPDTDADILKLQSLISKDANKAVRQTQSLLDVLQREPRSGIPPDALRSASRIAALYAVQAEAYNMLELDENARSTAEKGLALVPNEHDPVHLELLMAYASSVSDSAGIAAAIQSIEATRASQPSGSQADTCLLINRGLLEHRLGREDLAIVTLTAGLSRKRRRRAADRDRTSWPRTCCRSSCAAWAITPRRSS